MENSNKCVVIGVSGGIAAYKALDIVSTLKKNNIDVHVIMTKNAMEFVSPLAFQSLSGNMVIVDMFAEPKAWEIQHISLAKKADLILVAPTTANVIGKVAGGIADDMLTTTIMAAKCPVIFAPAMNTNMFENPIVADNINKLKNYGYNFIEPASGRLACGDIGKGKLADASLISGIVLTELYYPKDLKGIKVLVTAGPTIAPIDPVRSIVNRSSGKMGYAIAEEARDRGAEVTLISGPTNLHIPHGVHYIGVDTNEKMLNSVLDNFNDSDIIIKAAAVADYKVKDYSTNKIKKQNNEISIDLIKDNDILKRLGAIKTKQILVGFAAESNDLIHYAKEKLENKNLDYIVANDITSSEYGFASNDNKVTVLCSNGDVIPFEKMSKRETAKEIFNLIIKRR